MTGVVNDVDGIGVTIPGELDRRERMVPAEVHSTDARPMRGNIPMLDGNSLFRDREDAARPEDWDSFCASFSFVFWITRYDPLFFSVEKCITSSIVINVV